MVFRWNDPIHWDQECVDVQMEDCVDVQEISEECMRPTLTGKAEEVKEKMVMKWTLPDDDVIMEDCEVLEEMEVDDVALKCSFAIHYTSR